MSSYLRFEDYLDEQTSIKENEEFYITKCPLCVEELDYHKLKLYIKKDFSYGYCHRCKTTFRDREYVFKSPNILTRDPLYLDDLKSGIQVFTSLSKFNEASDKLDNKAREYFIKKRRNKDLIDLWDSYGMRCDYSGIYIPYPGFNYYIKALYVPVDGMKYYLPPTPEKPPFILERGSHNWIICEGIFDAIAISLLNSVDNIMAVTGSTMSRPQINYLRDRLPSSVIIFLDNSSLSNDLKSKLALSLPATHVSIIESDGEDPEEYYLRVKYGIIK